MSDNKIEFLETIQYLGAKTDENVSSITILIDNPDCPEQLKAIFEQSRVLLNVQKKLIANFVEQQFEVEDQLDRIIAMNPNA